MSNSPHAPAPIPRSPEKAGAFRLGHLLYVVTLLTAALATLGASGISLTIAVCVFWGFVAAHGYRFQAFIQGLALAVGGFCIVAPMILGQGHRYFPPPRLACAHNLKQITLALHAYHVDYDSFPPAYLLDSQGRPAHSWRVLILPYLHEQPLYDQYRFDEPWNGPNNSKLLTRMPSIYGCPAATRDAASESTCTNYVAVVGRNTMWPGSAASKGVRTYGEASPVLLTETAQAIPWLEPRDISLDAALVLVPKAPAGSVLHRSRDFFFERDHGGRHVAWVNARISYITDGLTRNEWSDMLTWGSIPYDKLPKSVISTRARLRLDNCLRLAVLIGVILWPLRWTWTAYRRRRASGASATA